MTMPKPPYQWDKAFVPISPLAIASNVMLVRADLPVSSVAELVDYAHRNPNKLTVATSSVGSINHFLAELLRIKAAITWTEVHYRGNSPAIEDLIAGRVDLGFQQLVDSLQYIQSGRLRALAVLGPKRASAIPDVPTIVEAGYPDVQGVTFNGLFAPKATPQPVIATLSRTIREALRKKSVVDRLAALGSDVRDNTPDEFANFLREETRKWREVMNQANIKVIE
jgi:tripartite-type tricarboxylate transporter receptor subunit TctC